MALPSAIAIDSGTVLVLIPLAVLPIAAIAFAMAGPAWRSIGKGPFAIEQELPPPRPPGELHQLLDPAGGEVDAVRVGSEEGSAQKVEVRQMLEAKAYRQRQRGEAEIDVEAELARALDIEAPPGTEARADRHAELEEEIRQLVVARNERRLRQGLDPLDVEAETRRELADLVGSD